MHCQEKGKMMDRRASPTQVSRAGREECSTSFCSNRVSVRRVRQLSGSREDSRDQCVDTLGGGRRRRKRRRGAQEGTQEEIMREWKRKE